MDTSLRWMQSSEEYFPLRPAQLEKRKNATIMEESSDGLHEKHKLGRSYARRQTSLARGNGQFLAVQIRIIIKLLTYNFYMFYFRSHCFCFLHIVFINQDKYRNRSQQQRAVTAFDGDVRGDRMNPEIIIIFSHGPEILHQYVRTC